MKSSRFKWEYRENASKLHRTVGDCLRSSVAFGQHEIYQEYPVKRVNHSYGWMSHHFDWAVPCLKIIIECHGKQHYVPVAFDGNYDTAVDKFHAQKKRDALKKEAALAAGYCYVEIPYSSIKNVSEEFILDKIELANLELDKYNEEHKEERELVEAEEKKEFAEVLKERRKAEAKRRRVEFLASEQHKQELKQARSYRQQRYKYLKELKNG